MLKFENLFGQVKNSLEVCYIKKEIKMNLTMHIMCCMMWKYPQRNTIA